MPPEYWELGSATGAHLRPSLFHRRGPHGVPGLLTRGWTDTLSARHPDARIYTFWKCLRNAFARDAGLRIDQILLNPAAALRLQSAGLDRDVRGWEHTSDHPQTWVTLTEVESPQGRGL